MEWNSSMVSVEFRSPSTSARTRSPISGEMSPPNCCRVVRKRLSLLSCRAPQPGDRGAVDEPLGVGGAPLTAVGEWPLLFIKRQTIDHFKQP